MDVKTSNLAVHLLSIALFTFFQGLPINPPAPPAPDRVIAKVDGVSIKAEDLAPYLWDWGGQSALDELIETNLVIAEAKRKGIELSDEELTKLVDTQLEPIRSTLPAGTTLSDAMFQRGRPLSLFATRLKKQVLLDRLFEKEFTTEGMLKISTIVFPIKSSLLSDLQLAVNQAQKAYDTLKKGTPWDKVITLMVEDPTIKETKGLLGWRNVSALPPTAAAEIKALPAKGVTKPVQTENGIQIFRVELKPKDASKKELDDLRASLTPGGRGQILTRIKSAAKVEKIRFSG